MISSQTIQTSIDELKAITKVDLSVYDPTRNDCIEIVFHNL